MTDAQKPMTDRFDECVREAAEPLEQLCKDTIAGVHPDDLRRIVRDAANIVLDKLRPFFKKQQATIAERDEELGRLRAAVLGFTQEDKTDWWVKRYGGGRDCVCKRCGEVAVYTGHLGSDGCELWSCSHLIHCVVLKVDAALAEQPEGEKEKVMIDPGQCPVCKFDGIVESVELEWEDEQILRFWCKKCSSDWRVKVTMQSEILPSTSAEQPEGEKG